MTTSTRCLADPLPIRELLLRLDDLDRRVLEFRLGFARRSAQVVRRNRPTVADLGHPGTPHRGAGAGDAARIVSPAGIGSAMRWIRVHNGRVRSDEGRGSAWWSRSRGLSKTVYESWKTSLHGQANRPTRVLGWAKTPTGFCIASPAAFSFGDQLAWQHLGWHEIERGGWNSELQ